MCLISFSACRLHVSGQCGVSSSWDCGTVSLFSLRICSSTHHSAPSGYSPADRRRTVAKATLPNLAPTTPAGCCCYLRYTAQWHNTMQPAALLGNLLVWVVQCVCIMQCITILLCRVMFHKVAKCRGVWYPVHLPCVALTGCIHLFVFVCDSVFGCDAKKTAVSDVPPQKQRSIFHLRITESRKLF